MLVLLLQIVTLVWLGCVLLLFVVFGVVFVIGGWVGVGLVCGLIGGFLGFVLVVCGLVVVCDACLLLVSDCFG